MRNLFATGPRRREKSISTEQDAVEAVRKLAVELKEGSANTRQKQGHRGFTSIRHRPREAREDSKASQREDALNKRTPIENDKRTDSEVRDFVQDELLEPAIKIVDSINNWIFNDDDGSDDDDDEDGLSSVESGSRTSADRPLFDPSRLIWSQDSSSRGESQGSSQVDSTDAGSMTSYDDRTTDSCSQFSSEYQRTNERTIKTSKNDLHDSNTKNQVRTDGNDSQYSLKGVDLMDSDDGSTSNYDSNSESDSSEIGFSKTFSLMKEDLADVNRHVENAAKIVDNVGTWIMGTQDEDSASLATEIHSIPGSTATDKFSADHDDGTNTIQDNQSMYDQKDFQSSDAEDTRSWYSRESLKRDFFDDDPADIIMELVNNVLLPLPKDESTEQSKTSTERSRRSWAPVKFIKVPSKHVQRKTIPIVSYNGNANNNGKGVGDTRSTNLDKESNGHDNLHVQVISECHNVVSIDMDAENQACTRVKGTVARVGNADKDSTAKVTKKVDEESPKIELKIIESTTNQMVPEQKIRRNDTTKNRLTNQKSSKTSLKKLGVACMDRISNRSPSYESAIKPFQKEAYHQVPHDDSKATTATSATTTTTTTTTNTNGHSVLPPQGAVLNDSSTLNTSVPPKELPREKTRLPCKTLKMKQIPRWSNRKENNVSNPETMDTSNGNEKAVSSYVVDDCLEIHMQSQEKPKDVQLQEKLCDNENDVSKRGQNDQVVIEKSNDLDDIFMTASSKEKPKRFKTAMKPVSKLFHRLTARRRRIVGGSSKQLQVTDDEMSSFPSFSSSNYFHHLEFSETETLDEKIDETIKGNVKIENVSIFPIHDDQHGTKFMEETLGGEENIETILDDLVSTTKNFDMERGVSFLPGGATSVSLPPSHSHSHVRSGNNILHDQHDKNQQHKKGNSPMAMKDDRDVAQTIECTKDEREDIETLLDDHINLRENLEMGRNASSFKSISGKSLMSSGTTMSAKTRKISNSNF